MIMQSLKITDFDDKPIGIIRISADNQVQLEVHDPAFQAHLSELVRKISTEPVPLRTGRRVEKDGTVSFVTQVKECRPGDFEFLAAVRDQVNKLRWEGRRLFGRLVDETEVGGG